MYAHQLPGTHSYLFYSLLLLSSLLLRDFLYFVLFLLFYLYLSTVRLMRSHDYLHIIVPCPHEMIVYTLLYLVLMKRFLFLVSFPIFTEGCKAPTFLTPWKGSRRMKIKLRLLTVG